MAATRSRTRKPRNTIIGQVPGTQPVGTGILNQASAATPPTEAAGTTRRSRTASGGTKTKRRRRTSTAHASQATPSTGTSGGNLHDIEALGFSSLGNYISCMTKLGLGRAAIVRNFTGYLNNSVTIAV